MKDLVRIIRYTWVLKPYYLATAFFVVVIALLNQANPFLLKFLVDAVVARGAGEVVETEHFALLLGLLFGAGVLVSLITNVQGYVGDILGTKLNTLLSQRYYDHLLDLPLEFYDNEITGRLTSRLERSIAGISELVQAMANNFITFFLASAFTLVILARYSPLVALLLALLFPIYIGLTTVTSRSWQKKQAGINADTDFVNGRFMEAISNIRVVKSFVYEPAESKVFARARRSIEAQTRVQSSTPAGARGLRSPRVRLFHHPFPTTSGHELAGVEHRAWGSLRRVVRTQGASVGGARTVAPRCSASAAVASACRGGCRPVCGAPG